METELAHSFYAGQERKETFDEKGERRKNKIGCKIAIQMRRCKNEIQTHRVRSQICPKYSNRGEECQWLRWEGVSTSPAD
jgi:hypothetical protein